MLPALIKIFGLFASAPIVPLPDIGRRKRLQFQDLFPELIYGRVTIDPTILFNNNGTTISVTVLDAELGDFVQVSSPYSLQGLIVTAYVREKHVVEIRVQNESGSTIDLGVGGWKVLVLKPNPTYFIESFN